MYSKKRVWVMRNVLKLLVLCPLLSLTNSYAENQNISLSVKPNRCIALHQGQTCYATLKFKWTTPNDNEYCLFSDLHESSIVCWIGSTLLRYEYDFKSDKNVMFDIRVKQNQQPLAQALVKISWIYKSNTKSTSRWRLF